MIDRTRPAHGSPDSHAVLWSAFAGALAVGLSTASIVALVFAVQPGGGAPPGAVAMFGLLGALLGVVAGAVAGASDTGARSA